MLTDAQLAALQADIAADPVLNALPANADSYATMAAAYNLPAAPVFTVWKTRATVDVLMGAGFDWTRVDNMTVGKARIWDFMTQLGWIDPSMPNVRAGVEAAFSVEAGDTPCRQAIYNGGSRAATRAERLYAEGTGTPPDNHGIGPGTMTFEGALSNQDVKQARLYVAPEPGEGA